MPDIILSSCSVGTESTAPIQRPEVGAAQQDEPNDSPIMGVTDVAGQAPNKKPRAAPPPSPLKPKGTTFNVPN